LNALKGAFNNATNGQKANYRYDFVEPLLIGYRETIGVIYNTKALNYVSAAAMRTTANRFLLPRTAFHASFTVKNTNPLRPLNIVGIHGPTSNPRTEDYREAVEFTNDLAEIGQINQAAVNPKQDTCIGGDFNCDPLNSYALGNGTKKKKIAAFDVLDATYQYKITLPNGTLTSLKDAVVNGEYLSQPYDNIVFRLPSQTKKPPVKRVNLIGNALAPLPTNNLVALFNAARLVSDHLPVTVEF